MRDRNPLKSEPDDADGYGREQSADAERFYEGQMIYRAQCAEIDPATKCHKCAPQCPLITIHGKPFCLLNSDQCETRDLANCDERYPYIHYDEARNRADFWVNPPRR